MTCIGVGADIWPCRVVGGKDRVPRGSGWPPRASRRCFTSGEWAISLVVKDRPDVALGERRCGLGKHVLRLRVDFRRAVASIDAMPHPANRNVPPPRGPAANSGSRPIPPPHAGIESSACGAPVVTHRVPNGHACLMAHDGAGAVSARNRLGSPSVSSRSDGPRSHARMSYSLAHCQTALEQRLALLASLRLASWISCCSSCRPCGPLPASARGCRRCPPLLLRLRLEPWPDPPRLPPLLDESGALAIAAARDLLIPFLRSPSYCLSSLTLDPWSLAMAIPLDR